MYTVVRHYKGNSKLIDELVQRQGEVEELIRGVPGFVAYNLVKSADGGFTITVCEDKAGTDESVQRAAAYLKENLASIAVEPPEIIEGESVIHFVR